MTLQKEGMFHKENIIKGRDDAGGHYKRAKGRDGAEGYLKKEG